MTRPPASAPVSVPPLWPTDFPQARQRRSSRRWLLDDGGYVLMEGPRLLGGPYPEISLVYGPAIAAQVARGRPRGRRAGGEHEHGQAGERPQGPERASWFPGETPGRVPVATAAPRPSEAEEPPQPEVLLLTAPRHAAEDFARDLVERLQAEGYSRDAAEAGVLIAHGAFDPSIVNAALMSQAHAQAFLRDWQAGQARLLDGGGDEDQDEARPRP